MRPRQVRVHRRSRAQVVVDLAPVHAEHVARKVEDGEHDGTVHVLVAAFGAQDAEIFQAPAQRRSGLPVLVRQRQPQLAIGKAQLKVADHLRMHQAAAFEIPQRFRRVLESVVIEAHHIAQGLLIVSIQRDRRWQFRRRATAHDARLSGG